MINSDIAKIQTERSSLNNGNIQHLSDLIKQISSSGKRQRYFFRSLICHLLLFATTVSASFEFRAPAPHSYALAGGGVAFHEVHFSLNPAALLGSADYSFAFAYSRPYGLKEMQHSHVSAGRSFTKIAMAAGMQAFGYQAYQENTYYTGLSFALMEGVDAGVSLRCVDLHILRYGHAWAFPVDFGMLVKVSGRTVLGFVVNNITGARIGRCREALPRCLQVGATIEALPQLHLCVDLFKDIRFAADVRCGADWRIHNFLALRAGMATSPAKLAAGLALRFNVCRFEYSVDTHEYLGLSHQCSLLFSWGRR
ncbi:hypothetical protein JXO59_06110 [candidate division KSB1 bacterium]|nr:hypothetical protein [candidate division KSB1 bacterium]